MSSVKDKTIRKRIKTKLTVKLMEGKTVRDMYIDFFRNKPLKEIEDKVTVTTVSLDGNYVSYELYKLFSGHGASREFLEGFEFIYRTQYKRIGLDILEKAIYEVVPFTSLSGVNSFINSYTLGSDILDQSCDLVIEIETSSFWKNISSDDIKRINKDNARRLRHYIVSLPSVQGVPYSCSFREDEVIETECSV